MCEGRFTAVRVAEVYRGADGLWYWRRCIRRGGRIVADGSEGYVRPSGASKAAARENPGIEVRVLQDS
jgi:hypothetical protein